MKWTSEGLRRFAKLCAGVTSFAWFLILFIISNGFAEMHLAGWVITIIGAPFIFAAVVALFWRIDWVIAGFRSDRLKSKEATHDRTPNGDKWG